MATTENEGLYSRLVQEIHAELGRRRLSQAALARAIGMKPYTLNRRLDPETTRPLDFDELEDIALALGMQLHELIERAEPSAPAGTKEHYAPVAHNPDVDIEYEQEETWRNQP